MILRPYQQRAIDAIYKFLRERGGNPCAVLPTAAGKTPILATLCRDAVVAWDGRVLILAHVKELLEQSAEKLRAICPTVPVGVYSAGLKCRDTAEPVIVAGIQSAYDKAEQLGRFDLVIVDEAHLIPAAGDGMYRRLIADLYETNPDLRVIGLTATPYRLGTGLICTPDGVLNEICYEVGVKELIVQGYLCPLVNKSALSGVDTSQIKIERGEYREDEAEAAFTCGDEVPRAVKEILDLTPNRQAVLLFCQTVRHAQMVAATLRANIVGRGEEAVKCLEPAREMFGLGDDPLTDHRLGVIADWLEEQNHPVQPLRYWLRAAEPLVGEIYGDTAPTVRAALIAAFRAGRLKYLVNVNVLTTGFDAPNVDCVCLLRATVSPGLYYQMVGRGFRLSEAKENCLVLDFGSNIVRHGPVDKVRPKAKGATACDGPMGKVCPECQTVAATNASVCMECGFAWPAEPPGAKHDGTASDESPVSGEAKTEAREVMGVTYRVHTKKGADDTAPKTMRVTYQTSVRDFVSEWVCVEHTGFAEGKARAWWAKRCKVPMPRSAVEAVTVADHGLLAVPTSVTVKTTPGKPFPEIVGCDLGPVPDRPTPCPGCGAVNKRWLQKNNEPRYPGRVVCGGCGHFYGYADAAMVARYGFASDPGGALWLLPWEFPEEEEEEENHGEWLCRCHIMNHAGEVCECGWCQGCNWHVNEDGSHVEWCPLFSQRLVAMQPGNIPESDDIPF